MLNVTGGLLYMESKENLYHFKRGYQELFPGRNRIISIVFDIVGFFLSLGLVYLGYSYGKYHAIRQQMINSKATVNTSASLHFSLKPSPAIQQSNSSEDCSTGYFLVRKHIISLCIPDRFTLIDQGEINQSVFRSPNEEFILETNSIQQWPLHMCTAVQTINIGSFLGARYIFKSETGAGCGAVSGYGIRLVSGEYSSLLPIILQYRMLNSGYIPDYDTFDLIEKSIRFN